MHEKFADSLRAATFVASGIHTDFPQSTLEITLESPQGGIRRECPSEKIGPLLGDLCARFPRASVYYHPKSAYGFVAQIRCHCGTEKAPGCCRANGRDRAWVLVTLKPAPDADRNAIHAAIVEEARKEASEHTAQAEHQHGRPPAKHHAPHKNPHHRPQKRSILDWFR